ncbi:PKD domain-containing protein [Epibacterium sp. SM1979]|uniref:PKD domain-containing protein n=1 Tax=Tritonibacter litoralis TaxID=2662264 RepID=A0A843YJG4_9RHOB|nr:right-handed parallel beta-helix repeat-containing protein [Tritonibacter litoralis]MQQ09574.1 PKD domain-containing protein [Tritonibacter litoralis]
MQTATSSAAQDNLVLTVSSSAELSAALATLQDTGGTIQVTASDTPYVLTAYQAGHADHRITIQAADPETPPLFDQIKLTSSHNITFDGISFDASLANDVAGRDLQLYSSWGITFANSSFKGTATGYYSGAAGEQAGGSFAYVRGGGDVVFENNAFTHLQHALTLSDVTGATVRNNDISHITGDGVRLSGVVDTTVEGNNFHSWFGSSHSINHDDMIQLWSSANNALLTQNLIIRDNILNASGPVATQSIFLRNEELSSGGAFQGITVENNVIYNGHPHGVTIDGADDVRVAQNTLVWNPEAALSGQSNAPTIRLNAVNGAEVLNNVTTGVVLDGVTGLEESGTLAVVYDDPNEETAVQALFANAATGGALDLVDLRARPGSLLETSGAGSDLIATATETPGVHAVLSQDVAIQNSFLVHYDATLSFQNAGLPLPETASFLWTFADGSTSTEPTVSHLYDATGDFAVTLAVTANGETNSITRTTRVETDVLLDWDSENPFQDTSTFDTALTVVVAEEPNTQPQDDIGSESGTYDTGFRLDGDSKIKTQRLGEDHLVSFDRLTLDLMLNPDAGDDGVFVHRHGGFQAQVKKSGSLEFRVETEDGLFVVETADNAVRGDQWQRITLVFDGADETGHLSVYLDSELAATGAASGNIHTDVRHSITIGNTWNKSLTGSVDDVTLYGSAKTEGWVNATADTSVPDDLFTRFAPEEDSFILQPLTQTPPAEEDVLIDVTPDPDVGSGVVSNIVEQAAEISVAIYQDFLLSEPEEILV